MLTLLVCSADLFKKIFLTSVTAVVKRAVTQISLCRHLVAICKQRKFQVHPHLRSSSGQKYQNEFKLVLQLKTCVITPTRTDALLLSSTNGGRQQVNPRFQLQACAYEAVSLDFFLGLIFTSNPVCSSMLSETRSRVVMRCLFKGRGSVDEGRRKEMNRRHQNHLP